RRKPRFPTPLIVTVLFYLLTTTPKDSRHLSVDAQSTPDAKFPIRVPPIASAAIIAARCEIDLSPGSAIVPRREVAGRIFIFHILDRLRAVCLDSNRLKPITYNE